MVWFTWTNQKTTILSIFGFHAEAVMQALDDITLSEIQPGTLVTSSNSSNVRFLKILNNPHLRRQISLCCLKNEKLTFLDLLVWRNANGTWDTNVQTKSQAFTAVTRTTKIKWLIPNLLMRARTHCPKPDEQLKTEEKILVYKIKKILEMLRWSESVGKYPLGFAS